MNKICYYVVLATTMLSSFLVVGCTDDLLPSDAQLSLVGRRLQLTTTSATFGANTNLTQTVEVSGENTPWTLTGLPSWLSASTTSGNGAASITLTAQENTSIDEDRTAVLTLASTAADYQYSKTITVSQHMAETVITVNGVSFKMIKVEGGTFQMGSNSGASDEQPVHQVTLTNDYYIGETEVTQALWRAVMGSEPTVKGDWEEKYGRGDRYPAYRVSWNGCQTFIKKLNTLTGKTFRLPTEAEWEFAARGGKKRKGYTYSGSNNIGDVAWYYGNSGSKTHEVATKAPNELGIYDMSGNVWEWCQDWYGSYSSDAQTNPTGPTSGSSRVSRGGSWGSSGGNCRMASRSGGSPSNATGDLGLRLVF